MHCCLLVCGDAVERNRQRVLELIALRPCSLHRLRLAVRRVCSSQLDLFPQQLILAVDARCLRLRRARVLICLHEGTPCPIQPLHNAASDDEDFGGAAASYGKALALDSKNSTARAGLAWALLNQGKAAQAKKEAQRALTTNRKAAKAHLVLGTLAIENGDEEAAAKSFRTYVQLEPNSPQAKQIRAVLKSQ